MKKVLGVTLVGLFIMGICSFALAEEPKGSMMGKEAMGEKGMMMEPGKMMGMCPMYKMMKRKMVATEDGGVIVMAGNKLLKYDKDLNLEKEAEIKMDIEGMKEMMEGMMKKCPMRKMMMGEDAKGSTGSGESEASSGSGAHH